jgi:hypothetical protein
MKRFLSTLLAAMLLSSLFASTALACDGDNHEKKHKQEQKK